MLGFLVVQLIDGGVMPQFPFLNDSRIDCLGLVFEKVCFGDGFATSSERDVAAFSCRVSVDFYEALVCEIPEVFSEALFIAVINVLLQGFGCDCTESSNIA